jgi:CheY-like chemotaxis protein
MSSLKETLETILVVDDTASVLKTVVAILENAKFLVLSADSGSAALALASKTDQTIHLLLSDVDMHGMSGPELGENLKNARCGFRRRRTLFRREAEQYSGLVPNTIGA